MDSNKKRINTGWSSLLDPSLMMLGYALVGIYFTFFEGRIPFVPYWQVDQNIILGLVWTAILIPGVLRVGRYSRGLFVHWQMTRFKFSKLLIILGFDLLILYFWVLMIASWFPELLPIPILAVQGGIWTGIITTVISIAAIKASNAITGKMYMKIVSDDVAKVEQDA